MRNIMNEMEEWMKKRIKEKCENLEERIYRRINRIERKIDIQKEIWLVMQI